ncbi:hypothetical protein, partial [Olsenella uli]|uniref:hypothetical protein n=1 Tax=Olsenella uli TaxID=133926 RepID=UPI001EE263F6
KPSPCSLARTVRKSGTTPDVAIDAKPKLVDIALVNADQRTRQSGKVFLTVQNLVRRMKELGKH